MASWLRCDALVVGGGLGGVAAAHALVSVGLTCILTEATDWLGGQATSQGVAALDEHRHIETFGATRSYAAFRAQIRAFYAAYRRPASDEAPLSPGNAWVSGLTFEPRAALWSIDRMLGAHRAAGRLTVLTGVVPRAVARQGDRLRAVRLEGAQGAVHVEARWFVDATDLGDLLPLAGVPYRVGAEARSETGEAHAPPTARPRAQQAFTFPIAVRWQARPGAPMPQPPGYAYNVRHVPYSLTLAGEHDSVRAFRMLEPGSTGLPFWTYRRLVDASQFDHPDLRQDIAALNWPGNDYARAPLVDRTAAARHRALHAARMQSLGFLHWLQTECPRDDGGLGYSEIQPAPDVFGTPTGLSKAPYIREGRRLVAETLVTETDVVEGPGQAIRARPWRDSVGVGWYPLDLHRTVVGDPEGSRPTLPFQIPLGALFTRAATNLLMGGKAMGTSHLANGAYRVHPVEWAVGEAAGLVAAWCEAQRTSLMETLADSLPLQRWLVAHGVPIYWSTDVAFDHEAFEAVQVLGAQGLLPSPKGLDIGVDDRIAVADAQAWLEDVRRRRTPRALSDGGRQAGIAAADVERLAVRLGLGHLTLDGSDGPLTQGGMARALLGTLGPPG